MDDDSTNNGWLTASDLRVRERRFAILDLETTGLVATVSNIVEIAIVELDADGCTTNEWSSLVNAPGEEELGATHIHGISRQMLAGAPTFAQLIDKIAERLRDHIIVGHVVSFDIAHLASECARANYLLPNIAAASICTRDLARQHLPQGSYALQSCCETLGIPTVGAHRALGDTRATAALFNHFINRIESATYQELMRNVATLAWPLARSTPPVALSGVRARPTPAALPPNRC